MQLIPTDELFKFKCLQFLVRVAFAMTIDKAQVQSLKVCGLNLENQENKKMKVYKFEEDLDELFDIAHSYSLDLMTIELDKHF